MDSAAPAPEVATLAGHPIAARILWQRGLRTAQQVRAFLDPAHYSPTPPDAIPDLDNAATMLRDCIAAGKPIRVWGDFDVDGQTATSVLVIALRALGARVDYTIPNRHTHSHGLNADGLAQAVADGVHTLLTCDCAVTDFDAIAHANALGLRVIVTDHHDLGDHLPAAAAVVNPKRLPAGHPLGSLPGVGVAYKLAQALLHNSPHSGLIEELLDLVALGIVADLADLRDDTRYLLQLGLRQLRKAARPGLRALLGIAAIEPLGADSESIGFQLAPRLNAAGRLDHASISVELLTCNEFARAQQLAGQVDALNLRRKDLQRSTLDEAIAMLLDQPNLLADDVIVLAAPHWNPAVLGLAASGITDRFNKPAIAIANPEGQLARGSARSVAGVDIHALIDAQKLLLEHSGGHPMAAGLGLRRELIDEFRRRINHDARKAGRAPVVASNDAFEVSLQDASLQLLDALEPLAPFGPGNPRPLFRASRVRVARIEPFGQQRQHVALHVRDGQGQFLRAVRFNSDLQIPAEPYAEIDLLFTLHRNAFAGKVEARAQIKAIHGTATQIASTPDVTHTARWQITDLRDIMFEQDYAVAQHLHGIDQREINYAGSWLGLEPRPVLVINEFPPGPDELSHLLETAQPQRILLVDRGGLGDDIFDVFMRSVAGMMKVAAQRGDALDDEAVIARMAARVHHRPATVREAIARLQGAGNRERLAELFAETIAYKTFGHTAPAEAVLRV